MQYFLFFIFLALGLLVQTGERGMPKEISGDPHAIYLYGQMMGALQGAKSLAFESRLRSGSNRDGTLKYFSHMTYKAWLLKPNSARLEVTSEGFGSKGILVGDGEHFWLYWPAGTRFFTSAYTGRAGEMEHDVYMKKPSPPGRHSLAHEICHIGTGMMCILELSSFHGYIDSMTPHLGAIVGKGEERVGEEMCDVIHLSFMKGQRERTIWLSRKDHLPRKLKEVVHVSYDITIEEEWTKVRLNEKLAPARFQWTPPEGWTQKSMPRPDDALLKKGDKAPDFSLRSAKNGKITLSDHRGKPVWLMFWRVG